MKVVTTVKNGCAAQSKNIQPQIPLRDARGGCVPVPVQSMRFTGLLLISERTVSPHPVSRKIGQQAGRHGDAGEVRIAAVAEAR
jgi:hypothetical protein